MSIQVVSFVNLFFHWLHLVVGHLAQRTGDRHRLRFEISGPRRVPRNLGRGLGMPDESPFIGTNQDRCFAVAQIPTAGLDFGTL